MGLEQEQVEHIGRAADSDGRILTGEEIRANRIHLAKTFARLVPDEPTVLPSSTDNQK